MSQSDVYHAISGVGGVSTLLILAGFIFVLVNSKVKDR